MNKDEILSKSRKENKERDLYEMEVQIKAGNIGSLAATFLATALFIIQSIVGDGMDLGLYAIIFAVSAAGYCYKAVHMKRRRDIVLGVLFSLITLALSAVHIYGLI